MGFEAVNIVKYIEAIKSWPSSEDLCDQYYLAFMNWRDEGLLHLQPSEVRYGNIPNISLLMKDLKALDNAIDLLKGLVDTPAAADFNEYTITLSYSNLHNTQSVVASFENFNNPHSDLHYMFRWLLTKAAAFQLMISLINPQTTFHTANTFLSALGDIPNGIISWSYKAKYTGTGWDEEEFVGMRHGYDNQLSERDLEEPRTFWKSRIIDLLDNVHGDTEELANRLIGMQALSSTMIARAKIRVIKLKDTDRAIDDYLKQMLRHAFIHYYLWLLGPEGAAFINLFNNDGVAIPPVVALIINLYQIDFREERTNLLPGYKKEKEPIDDKPILPRVDKNVQHVDIEGEGWEEEE